MEDNTNANINANANTNVNTDVNTNLNADENANANNHVNIKTNTNPNAKVNLKPLLSAIKVTLAVAFGLLHRWHVSTLFENERHFSHLSDIEREMSFRTEMGMYYSYFKTFTESRGFFEGMEKIKNDNLSEYPNVINAESKYTLAPEVNIGMLYHIIKYLGLMPTPVCWQIERGEGLSAITSCEGLAVPVYFYLEFVWMTTIFTGAGIFLYATSLSESILGGIIAIASFFYNHTESTRVQWTPPLRESFAYPLLLFEMFTISKILKSKKRPESFSEYVDFMILIVYCLFSWQFSQFVFVTQTIAMLILKWLKVIDTNMYSFYCSTHLISAIMVITLTSNSFLLNSLHISLLIVSYLASRISQSLSSLFDSKTVTLLEIAVTLICSKLWKILFTSSADDGHIFNILRSKVSNYKDFHTQLYTCSAEFDFLKYETYEAIISTFLLPTAILAGFLVLYYWYRNLHLQGFPKCVEPHIAYNFLQTGAFIVMAIFVMRLKLFMTPHLCIIAGLVCSTRYLEKLKIKRKTMQAALIAGLLASMSYHGFQRLQKERQFIGEYSNVDQEELLEWIKTKTPKNAVFAGKMSLMANIMLSTRRPIVNNPYYENKEMQDRTMKVYEIFSRKSVAEVHDTLRKLQVDYVVIEESLCYGYGYWKPGCKMLDLWDLVDKGRSKSDGRPPVCPILFRGRAHPFRRVFENRSYSILQLNYTKYIEYKPKTILYTS